MKTAKFIALLGFLLICIACEKGKPSPPPGDKPIHPGEFSAVSIDGDIKVVFKKKQAGDPQGDQNTVLIHANQEQRPELSVDNQSGILKIRASQQIELEDGVVVQVISGHITELRLEANQRSLVEGNFEQEQILIVTQANSQLEIENLKVEHLRTRQQGGSLLEISSRLPGYPNQTFYANNTAHLVDQNTLVVENMTVIKSDSISINGGGFNLHGINNEAYALLREAEILTLGTATFKGYATPIAKVHAKIAGNTGAQIWALDSLSGSAEGDSFIALRGNPDTTGFQLYGDARLFRD